MTTQNFGELVGKESIEKAAKALSEHNFIPEAVETGAGALARIKELIPAGASVMNGSSTTLQQIGYVDYLKEGQHGWNNLHAGIIAEKDPAKQALLRKQSVVSDWYLGSAHAVTEEGEIVIASNSGSQLPHLAFTSPNIVLVVSTKKIVPTLSDAFRRLEEHVIPLEDVRLMQVFNAHTMRSKTLILHKENPAYGRNVYILLVSEDLGF